MRSSGGPHENLALPSQPRFENIVPDTLPTSNQSVPHVVADVSKDRLADICKAMHRCPDDTADKYEAVSKFQQPAKCCPDKSGSTFFKEARCVVSSWDGLETQLCSDVK